MKQLILSAIGDGNGNISTARILSLLTALTPIVTEIYNAIITKQPITISSTDVEMFLAAAGLKLGSHALENQSDKQTGVQTTTPKA